MVLGIVNLPCTGDDVVPVDDPTDLPAPKGRLVASFDVGRTRDRSELAVFEDVDGRFVGRLLRSHVETPFATQEADLRRLLEVAPLARLSIDRSGIGMNLAESLSRDFPQVVGEVAFDAERTAKSGHADRFWAVVLACQKERVAPRGRGEIGVRVLG